MKKHILLLLLITLPAFGQWTRMSVTGSAQLNTRPLFRGWTKLVDDPALGIVAFGGTKGTSGSFANSLWSYDAANNAFSLLSTFGANTPTAREPFYQYAYDSLRHGIWLYSGQPATGALTDTWFFNLETKQWTQFFPPTNPGSKQQASMVYIASQDVLMLFGGYGCDSFVGNDVWYYHPTSNTWELVVKNNSKGLPSTRHGNGMVYDPVHDKVVMFGGRPAGYYYGDIRNDTWVWNPQTRTWTNATPATGGPNRQKYPPMTWDSKRQVVTLYNGAGTYGDDALPPPTLWTFDAGTLAWTQQSITGGPFDTIGESLNSLSLAYDPVNDVYVYQSYGDSGHGYEIWQAKLQ